MKFRKKPVVIDAIHIQTVQDAEQAIGICTGGHGCPTHGPDGSHPHVHTPEGDHTWTPGDWLITGIQGERYFCKPDIFAATYEAVWEARPSSGATPGVPGCLRRLTCRERAPRNPSLWCQECWAAQREKAE